MDYYSTNEKCGCNSYATKRISKTADKTRIIISNSATIAVWSKLNILLIVFVMIQLMPIDSAAGLPLRRARIHKRHSSPEYNDMYIQYPCQGEPDPVSAENITSFERRQAFNNLRRSIRQKRNDVLNMGKNPIITKNLTQWKAYEYLYDFLPQIEESSKVKLVKWYRLLQSYAVSFTYLGRRQQKWDHKNNNGRISGISKELSSLYLNSLELLCQIQSTINATNSVNKAHKIPPFNRTREESRLRFVSMKHEDPESTRLDSAFAYARYRKFLRGMQKSLSIRLGPKRASAAASSSANSSGSSSASASAQLSNESQSQSSGVSKRHQRRGHKRLRGAKAPWFNNQLAVL